MFFFFFGHEHKVWAHFGMNWRSVLALVDDPRRAWGSAKVPLPSLLSFSASFDNYLTMVSLWVISLKLGRLREEWILLLFCKVLCDFYHPHETSGSDCQEMRATYRSAPLGCMLSCRNAPWAHFSVPGGAEGGLSIHGGTEGTPGYIWGHDFPGRLLGGASSVTGRGMMLWKSVSSTNEYPSPY